MGYTLHKKKSMFSRLFKFYIWSSEMQFYGYPDANKGKQNKCIFSISIKLPEDHYGEKGDGHCHTWEEVRAVLKQVYVLEQIILKIK